MKKATFKYSIPMLLLPLLVACGGLSGLSDSSSEESAADGSAATVTTNTGAKAFPTDLAVASPVEVTDESTSASVSSKSLGGVSSRYTWVVSRLNILLAGASPAICTFDPELFLTQETDADCYGPTLAYEAHPDATSSASPDYDGSLPSGDVGIWNSTATSGHACAAAQLNSRMAGIRDRSLAALSGLASMICAANSAGITLPTNATEDLTAEMNALAVTDTTFYSATITHDDSSGSDEWSYEMDIMYAPGSDTHGIIVLMTHIPGSSVGEYQGRVSMRINDTKSGGNCPSADVTRNGSLLYNRTASAMEVEVRSGEFCESASDGMVDGLVDASLKYDASTNPTGWGNNFSVLTANFDPSTMEGDFAYSWQAGPNDANTRVINIRTTEDATNVLPAAETFVGYGADIDGSDGGIDGFICNWAGPNNSHTTQDLAQYQAMEFDTGTSLYTVLDEDITYAPTTSCDYDGAGSFTYDSDGDGSVDTDPTLAVSNDLQALTDADTNGAFDEIEATGFAVPTAPSNI
jgi:hypothetical protein